MVKTVFIVMTLVGIVGLTVIGIVGGQLDVILKAAAGLGTAISAIVAVFRGR